MNSISDVATYLSERPGSAIAKIARDLELTYREVTTALAELRGKSVLDAKNNPLPGIEDFVRKGEEIDANWLLTMALRYHKIQANPESFEVRQFWAMVEDYLNVKK